MKDTISSFINDLKNLLVEYLETRLQLTKISAFEKIAKIFALLFSVLIVLGLSFFFVFFLSMMSGFYLAQVTGSNFIGFGIVAGVYALLITITIVFRKKLIENYLRDKIISILFEKDNEQDSNL